MLSSYVTYAKNNQIRVLCDDGSTLLLYRTIDASGNPYVPVVGEYITIIANSFMMYLGEIETVGAVILQSYDYINEEIKYCNGLKNDTKLESFSYMIKSSVTEKKYLPVEGNGASYLNLDESLWTVTLKNNDSGLSPYCLLTGEFRLYVGRNSEGITNNGNEIVFTLNEGTIKNIKIYYSVGYDSKATVIVDENSVQSLGNDIYTINSNSFSIKNETSSQVRIYLIEVELFE